MDGGEVSRNMELFYAAGMCCNLLEATRARLVESTPASSHAAISNSALMN